MQQRIIILLFLFGSAAVFAQKKNDSYRYEIRKTTSPITVDGVHEEQVWLEADVANDFFMVLPMDNQMAVEKTEVRMTYDEKNLYLIATCFKTTAGTVFVESLRRDFVFGKNDNFLFFLDPFNNQTTGYSFGANAAGAQWDGTMYEGGKVDLNWDNKWISEVKQDDEKWVFEMALPFKSIRYKAGVKEWGINFSRLDLRSSEKSSWTPIPRQFPTASLAYTGVLVWDAAPPSVGANFSMIPYVLATMEKEDKNSSVLKAKVGGDVKIALSSSLNLDLTINPDFSQVEVDRQVTNLDRYELFFPEKRQFFLENGDIFSSFGYPTLRPFFSRRIGLGVPIHAGARLSGNLTEKWRIGLMNMQTASIDSTGLPSQNFAVVSVQRKIFSRSNIAFLFVNKESTNYPVESDSIKSLYPEFNRNLGVEYNLASSNNFWTGKAFLLKSFSPNSKSNGLTQAAHIQFNNRKWSWLLREETVDNQFSAEVGFVPRTNYFRTISILGYLFFPKQGAIVSHGPKLESTYFFTRSLKKTDQQNFLAYSLNFRNRAVLKIGAVNEYVELLVDNFDPTNSGKEVLESGSVHQFNGWQFSYESKPQSMFTYSIDTYQGNYYLDGKRLNLTSEIGYRFQPYVSVKSNLSYNRFQLPEPWGSSNFWLIGSNLDITFTNKLFFATLFQYNKQNHTFNLNSRLQWRFKPASDFFIVYTDNQLLTPFTGRFRSLTMKFTYWFTR